MKVTTYLRMMMKIYNKYDAQFLSSNNHEDVPTVIEYDSVKRRVCHHKNVILGLLLLNQIVFNIRYQFFCSWQQ